MKNFSQSILAKIKQEKLTPRARWIFQFKNLFFWSLGILTIIAAGILLTALLEDFLLAEWEIFSRHPGGQLHFFYETISWLWLISLIALLAIAFVIFRHTKQGYRYATLGLAGVVLVASFGLGISLYPTKIPSDLREFHRQYLGERFDPNLWHNPDQGFLIGKILKIKQKELLLDTGKQKWQVNFAKARMPQFLKLAPQQKIRIMGKKISEGIFEANFIHPERPPQKIERKFRQRTY
jgi:hypothetical protein